MTPASKTFAVSVTTIIVIIVAAAVFHKSLVAVFADTSSQSSAEAAQANSYRADGDVLLADHDALNSAGVQIQKIETHDVPMTLTLTGKSALNLETATHVQPQFGGKVIHVAPKLGDAVKGPDDPAGPTVLCVIESNDLAQAKANYLQTKIQLKIDDDALIRTRELFKANVLAEKFVIDAESAVIKDQATLEASRQQLLIFGLKQPEIDDIEHQIGKQRMEYVITSPRSGVVAEKDLSGGEIATPGNNLFVIADTKTLWVVGDVYERDLSRIKLGQPMKVYFTSEPDRARECKIEWISPVLDPNTHSVHVQGVVDNSDRHLLSDMYCTIVVTIADGKDSLIVPADAVVREESKAFVFVQTGTDGSKPRLRLTPVQIEPVDVGFGTSAPASAAIGSAIPTSGGANPASGSVRIVAGIHTGDLIVTHGALGLYNEMKEQASLAP
jgi:cobalt-zinc-cadmium efflux system membrane fusion protein